jgi:hypothetical protein
MAHGVLLRLGMRLPRFALILVLAGSFGLPLVACSGSNGGSDAGTGCPSSPPSEGTPCLVNGTTCSYGGGETPNLCGGGGGTVAVCTNGSWTFEATAGGGGAPGYVACPTTIPTQGSPCTVSGCGGAQPSCSYGCDQGGPASATCNGSTWQVSREGIDCAVDASIDSGDGGDAGEGGEGGEGGTSCHARSDCGSSDYCQPPGGPQPVGYPLDPHCTTDTGCPADAAAGLCDGTGCVCQSSQYAPQPASASVCAPPCTVDGDCATLSFLYGDGTGFVCGTGGHCVPKSCSTASDCPANFDCDANQCVRRSCTADTDCAPSGVCVDGACYPSAGTCLPIPA